MLYRENMFKYSLQICITGFVVTMVHLVEPNTLSAAPGNEKTQGATVVNAYG